MRMATAYHQAMATIILPDLDEQVLDQARSVVAASGGSLDEELRLLVEARAREAKADRRQLAEAGAAAMKAYAESMHAKYGPFPDSTELLRQERESW